ncbi:MAG: hypothetical protein AAF610_03325 [Pseudomonadota bacterium]
MRIKALVATAALMCVGAAQAAPITFVLEYAGVSGSSATASGSVTFDDALFPNELSAFFNAAGTSIGVLGFELTITGSANMDGDYTLADLGPSNGSWVWQLAGPLDLTQNLVGQANFTDFNWLCEINGGGPCAAGTPQGLGPLLIGDGLGEDLALISMTAVPLPGAVWLLGSALLGVAVRARTTGASV